MGKESTQVEARSNEFGPNDSSLEFNESIPKNTESSVETKELEINESSNTEQPSAESTEFIPSDSGESNRLIIDDSASIESNWSATIESGTLERLETVDFGSGEASESRFVPCIVVQ